MTPTKKLYRVVLKGFSSSPYGESYVVAINPDEAYRTVRKHLDKIDYGFVKDREMELVALVAESYQYTDTGSMLFISPSTSGIDEVKSSFSIK